LGGRALEKKGICESWWQTCGRFVTLPQAPSDKSLGKIPPTFEPYMLQEKSTKFSNSTKNLTKIHKNIKNCNMYLFIDSPIYKIQDNNDI